MKRAVEFETLGDIAKTLQRMKADGWTIGSVVYAVNKVWWEGPEYAFVDISQAAKEEILRAQGQVSE